MELIIELHHPDAAEIIRQLRADPNPAEVIAIGLANINDWREEEENSESGVGLLPWTITVTDEESDNEVTAEAAAQEG